MQLLMIQPKIPQILRSQLELKQLYIIMKTLLEMVCGFAPGLMNHLFDFVLQRTQSSCVHWESVRYIRYVFTHICKHALSGIKSGLPYRSVCSDSRLILPLYNDSVMDHITLVAHINVYKTVHCHMHILNIWNYTQICMTKVLLNDFKCTKQIPTGFVLKHQLTVFSQKI